MSIEDRVRTELREAASRYHVDTDALYAATRERIERPARPRRRHTRVLVAASAAAVVGIAAAGLWLDRRLDGADGPPPANQGELIQRPVTTGGAVDTEFSCADTRTNDAWQVSSINVANPRLGWMGIERSQFIPNGETGTLRVGPSDGTLTARLTMRPGNDGWVVESIEHCTGPKGPGAPVRGRFELGRHGSAIPEAPKLQDGPRPTSSIVAIDDRPYYNGLGVIDHRTIYGYERGGGRAMTWTVARYLHTPATGLGLVDSRRPTGGGLNFVPKGLNAPWQSDFAFVTYYSIEPAALTAELTDGTTVEAEEIRGDDWKGTLYAVLAPRDQVERVIVERDGETTSHRLRDLR